MKLKKRILKTISLVVVLSIVGYNAHTLLERNQSFPDLLLQNVEALAGEASGLDRNHHDKVMKNGVYCCEDGYPGYVCGGSYPLCLRDRK